MAGTKRPADRSADGAAPSPKARKAAVAARRKLLEMQESDEELSELEDMLEWEGHLIKQEDAIDESETVAYAGCKQWKTSSRLTSGGPLTEVSKVNNSSWQFTQSVEIHHKEPFTLKPLILTEGPLQGRHVLLLEPVVTEAPPTFRFLDLPPEIRALIYGYAFAESGLIHISSYKPPGQPRRPVRSTFRSHHQQSRKTVKWDRVLGKWIGEKPSALTILGVSKLVLDEASPILYGNNTFSFDKMTDADIFLDSIGSMCRHIRAISLDGRWSRAYVPAKAVSVFDKLKDAKQLHTISFLHAALCGSQEYYRHLINPEYVYANLLPLMKALHKAQSEGESPHSVLDLVKINKGVRCYSCNPSAVMGLQCRGKVYSACKFECKDVQAHCEEIMARFRTKIARDVTLDTSPEV